MTGITLTSLRSVLAQASELFLQTAEAEADSERAALLARQQSLWQHLADRCSQQGFLGLADICLLFAESLQSLQANPKLSDEQWQRLDCWYTYSGMFFDAPQQFTGLKDWLACLEALDADDIDELLTALQTDSQNLLESGQEEKAPPASNPQDGMEGEPLQPKISQETLRSVLAQASELFLQTAEAEADSERAALLARQQSLWQHLADRCSQQGFLGLADICLLFAESLQSLQANPKLSDEQWQRLDCWYTYSGMFFDAPQQFTGLKDWLACLEALDADDIDELLTALQTDSQNLLESGQEEKAPPASNPQDGMEGALLQPETDAEQAQPVPMTFIELIATELNLFIEEFSEHMGSCLDSSLDAYQSALNPHRDKLNNFQAACQAAGLFGLARVFGFIGNNLAADPPRDFDFQQEFKLLKSSLLLIQDYLAHTADPEKAKTLVSFLQMAGWRQPLGQQAAAAWPDLLRVCIDGEEAHDVDRVVLEAEALDLNPSDQVDAALLASILAELPVLSENFSQVLQAVLQGDRNRLQEAQRIAHTLKGTAGMAGIAGIATLTHALEDIFEYLAEHSVLPPAALSELLVDAADCLESMCEAVRGEGPPPENSLAMAQAVLDWHHRIKTEGLPEDDAAKTASETANQAAEPASRPEPKPAAIAQTDPDADNPITVSSRSLDTLMRSIGEQGVLNTQLDGKSAAMFASLQQIQGMNRQLEHLSAELEQLLADQKHYAPSSSTLTNHAFDALEMDQYNELHTFVNRLAEAGADIRVLNGVVEQQLRDFKSLLTEQAAMQKEDWERLQAIRRVPAEKIVSRCQRIVRQTARATGKTVELVVKGEQTLIDTDVLNRLAEPLMHLLRNAVDHGIETKERRVQAGKPETGRITLEFANLGHAIQVCCRDDGSGLDRAAILETALAKGLINPEEAKQRKDDEIYPLILHPGFSTRSTRTQVSGRGIGMDVVNHQVKQMKGTMSLVSTPGQGLEVRMVLPLLMATTPSLLVQVANTVFALSEQGIRQIFSSREGRVIERDGQVLFQHRNQYYPVEYLNALLGLPDINPEAKKPALLLSSEQGEPQIVFVDRILGRQELLVKSFGDYVPTQYGILGGAVLADGSVAIVLDLSERIALQQDVPFDSAALDEEALAALPRILVVDDSLSARQATAQLLRDNGYEVDTAIDGLDGIEKIERQRPNLILADMEMPRMNGLEFSTHIRNQEAWHDIPIIMITSRSARKHRELAQQAGVNQYLTKPFTEDDLMEWVNRYTGNAVSS